MRSQTSPLSLEPANGDFVKFIEDLEKGKANLNVHPAVGELSIADISPRHGQNANAKPQQKDSSQARTSVLNEFGWGKTSSSKRKKPSQKQTTTSAKKKTDPGLFIFLGVVLMMGSVFAAIVFGIDEDLEFSSDLIGALFCAFIIGARLVILKEKSK